MTLTEEQIAEIRAREEAATPGPWKWWTSNSWNRLKSDDQVVTRSVAEPFVNQYDQHPDLSINEADMDFIAHARTDIPALLSALEAAEKEVKDARRAGLILATALHQRWYRDNAPSWEPFEHAPGLLSQIDNMTAGLGQRLEAANKRADEAEALVETLKREAHLHAQEARTANATIAEIYREVSGGKGEPGNWNGAEPVRAELTALRARVAVMQEALEIIAGKRQCLDNLMGNKDVALAALKGVSHEQG